MKTQQISKIMLLGILVLFQITCKKESKFLNQTNPTLSSQLERAPKQPDGPKNYCQECGTNFDPNFSCLIVDVFSEGIPPIQCTVKLCPGSIIEHYDSVFQNPNQLNTTDAHHIKQKLIETNSKFRAYLNHADVISRCMIEKNTITISNLSNHINASNLAIDACMRYLYGGNDEIIIKQDIYDSGISLIQIYREMKLGTTLENTLNALESDLKKFKGLTKSQISVYVEN